MAQIGYNFTQMQVWEYPHNFPQYKLFSTNLVVITVLVIRICIKFYRFYFLFKKEITKLCIKHLLEKEGNLVWQKYYQKHTWRAETKHIVTEKNTCWFWTFNVTTKKQENIALKRINERLIFFDVIQLAWRFLHTL